MQWDQWLLSKKKTAKQTPDLAFAHPRDVNSPIRASREVISFSLPKYAQTFDILGPCEPV